MWMVIALAVTGAIVALVTALRRGDSSEHLGTVSAQWVAEHRLGSPPDGRR